MNSVLHQIPARNKAMHDSVWLRSKIAGHMREFKSHYIEFTDPTKYETHLQEMTNDGYWNFDLMDIVPLVIANIFQCQVKILSSVADRGVLEFLPTMQIQASLLVNGFTLAHIGIPGRQHYNSVTAEKQERNDKCPLEPFDGESDIDDLLVETMDTLETSVQIQENMAHLFTSPIQNEEQGDSLSTIHTHETTKSPPSADVLRATRVVLDHDDPEMLTPDVIKEITMTQSEPQENSDSYCCVVTLNDNNEGKENNCEDNVVLNSMPDGNSVGQENRNTDTMPCTIVNDISNNNNEEMDNTFAKRRKSKIPQPDMWKKNINKKARNSGQKYTSSTGEDVPARKMKNNECSCRYKCASSVAEDIRQKIFKEYWGTASRERQWDFIASMTKEEAPKFMRQGTDKHRSVSRTFFLPANDTKVRVCKAFFMSTLSISASTIATAMQKKQVTPITTTDKRGRKVPGNKLPDVQIDKVHAHIKSFPTMHPH